MTCHFGRHILSKVTHGTVIAGTNSLEQRGSVLLKDSIDRARGEILAVLGFKCHPI